jgi:hypothetical protein
MKKQIPMIILLTAWIAFPTALIVGCSTPHPTAPTPPKPSSFIPAAQMTSRVNPADFDIDELNGLSLDHNPFAPGVSMCRTMQREYCEASGQQCWWETDYYTVEDPDKCPVEPIP